MNIRSKWIYVSIASVSALALLLLFVLTDAEFFEELAAIPLFSAMVAALFVIVRDHAAHERAQQLLETKNNFLVGASSHMANVAFDKHAEFAGEYINEAHYALVTLFQEGPTDEALIHATNLYEIQKKYRVWLTVNIEERLDKFEGALREVGAGARYEKNSTSAANVVRIDKMYKAFAEIVGFEEWEGDTITKDNAVTSLIRWIRGILGTEELTKLRGAIVKKAAEDAIVKDESRETSE